MKSDTKGKLQKTIVHPRDGQNTSPWQTGLNGQPAKAVLYGNDEFDVLIIGGGITGLTAGLLLQNAGKRVLIIEAHRPGFGTTGGTSAHINTFADTSYKEAQSAF